MKLTQMVYYVPYNYPRWGACMRHYRRTRMPREINAHARRARLIRQWIHQQSRMGKQRTNWFKENRRIRLNFSGSSRFNKWY